MDVRSHKPFDRRKSSECIVPDGLPQGAALSQAFQRNGYLEPIARYGAKIYVLKADKTEIDKLERAGNESIGIQSGCARSSLVSLLRAHIPIPTMRTTATDKAAAIYERAMRSDTSTPI